jgi:excisionase family DNA binding protein
MSLRQAADALGVHYMTAYRYVRLGLLPASQRGGTWVIRSEDVAAFRERAAADRTPAGAGRRRPGALRDRLMGCLLGGDEASAWSVVDRALGTGYSPTDIYLQLLAPALRSIGDGWHAGSLSVGEEHRATAVAARLVGRLGPSFVRRGRPAGTVVLGAAPGDAHSLPVSMLADVVRAHGYRVVDLGGNVPVVSFTAAAAGLDGLVAVGVSVGDAGCLDAAREVATAVRAVAAVPVLIGGPATDASVTALGADGWAPDAGAAADLIDRLRHPV